MMFKSTHFGTFGRCVETLIGHVFPEIRAPEYTRTLIVSCALASLALMDDSTANAATALSPAPAFYDRVVRLVHASHSDERQRLVATAVVPAEGMHADVYLADRDGAPFRQIGEITDPTFNSGLCCGTLYELPRPVGVLRAGTLLWAAAVGKKTERMAARIYRSDDEGRTWSFLSEIRAANPGGIWEPDSPWAATAR